VRLVGLAVAGADLVFEINDAGSILFALGAAEYLTGIDDDALVGCGWNAVLDDEDVAMMAAIGPTVSPGERQGPFRVRLRSAPGSRPAPSTPVQPRTNLLTGTGFARSRLT
jgi:PAS domain-containing protein